MKRNDTLRYGLIHAFFWINFAVVLNGASIYLLEEGFDNSLIGIILALGNGSAALLQGKLASYADRKDAPALKCFLSVQDGTAMILMILLIVLKGISAEKVYCGIVYGLSVMVLQMMIPFINALGTESINSGQELNFGLSRSFGSASYALMSFAVGTLIARMGTVIIPQASFFFFLILEILFLLYPSQKTEGGKQDVPAIGLRDFIKKYPSFLLVLIGTGALLYASQMMLVNYAYQIVLTKGGGSSEMGIAHAISGIAEIPAMFLFGKLLKKMPAGKWLVFSGIFYILKAFLSLVCPGVISFYLVQLLQMPSFGIYCIAIVYYTNSITEEEDSIKGQAYSSSFMAVGSIVSSLLGGFLLDLSGANLMMIVSMVLAVFGTLLTCRGIQVKNSLQK